VLPLQGGYHASYCRRWDTSCLEAREHATIRRRYSRRCYDSSGCYNDKIFGKGPAILLPILQELFHGHLSRVSIVSRVRPSFHIFFQSLLDEIRYTGLCNVWSFDRDPLGLCLNETIPVSRTLLFEEDFLQPVSTNIPHLRIIHRTYGFRYRRRMDCSLGNPH